MIQGAIADDGLVTFPALSVARGAWSQISSLSMPDDYVPDIKNFDLEGGIPVSMKGDADMFLDDEASPAGVAWPNDGGVINLLTYHRDASGTVTYIIATTAGIVYKWIGGATHTWTIIRKGLSTTSTLWWSSVRYGTDLYISNPTDGIYRYDGTNLIPVGAKTIAMAEASEAADWTNETDDTTDWQQGLQAYKVQSGNPGASSVLTYNPTAALDTSTGRGSARTYALLKATGTDCYHFKLKWSANVTITAATTTFVITDTGAKTLTWDATKWRSARSTSAAAVSLTATTWQDVYCFPSEATESATFNPAIVDKLEWKVTTSGGQTWMTIDDVYSIYVSTMANVNYLAEWRNMLWGATGSTLYFSPENAPDEWNTLATLGIKSNGDQITGLKNFYNQLTITTETQVHTISGTVGGYSYPGYLFDINMVTDELGCSSHRSMVKAAEKLYWWFNDSIVEYDGTNARKISYAILPTLQDHEPTIKQLFVGAAFRSKNQIWWTYAGYGSSSCDEVIRYDYVHNAFLFTAGLTTILLCQVYDGSNEYLLSTNSTTRLVKKQGQTGVYTFSGTAIATTLALQPMCIPGKVLEWNDSEIFYLDSTGSLVVSYRIADHLRELSAASYTTAETINMALAGEYGKVRFGDRARFFQLRFTGSGVLITLEFPITVKAAVLGAPHVRVTP